MEDRGSRMEDRGWIIEKRDLNLKLKIEELGRPAQVETR